MFSGFFLVLFFLSVLSLLSVCFLMFLGRFLFKRLEWVCSFLFTLYCYFFLSLSQFSSLFISSLFFLFFSLISLFLFSLISFLFFPQFQFPPRPSHARPFPLFVASFSRQRHEIPRPKTFKFMGNTHTLPFFSFSPPGDCKPNPMPLPDTVGIFTLAARSVGTCKNPDPVPGFNICSGHCDSFTTFVGRSSFSFIHVIMLLLLTLLSLVILVFVLLQ